MPISSKERMLAALRHQEPDHVPFLLHTFGFRPPAPLRWSNQYEEAQCWLSLGLDAWLGVGLPVVYHPDVKVREWQETVPGQRWPLMVKEYDTPSGAFRQEVYRTDDWITPEWPEHKRADGGVQLFDDYNVPASRSRRFLVQGEEDIDKLKYLLHPLSPAAIAEWRERAAAVVRQAQELGVLVHAAAPAGADVAAWLCGVEGMVYLALDRPAVFEALLEVIHAWDRRNMEIMLDMPIDLFLRRGYYEGTTFWSPAMYRRFFAPPIRQIADMVHQQGRLMGYTMSVGVMPLLDTLPGLGYDVHNFLDPIGHDGRRLDLARIKTAFAGKTAVIGGINEHRTLEQGSREEIRAEVFAAVRALAPGGGLVLNPVEAVMASTPWRSIEIAIEAWKEVRDYPLSWQREEL